MTDPDTKAFSGTGWQAGGLLALLAVLGVGLLSGTHELTRERIHAQERAATLALLGEVLDPSRYDNDLLADTLDVEAPEVLGHDRPLRIYRAWRDGQPEAVVMEVTATDGYNGDIVFLLGVDREGKITGARVTRHRETPGLGDPIEARRSDWILAFAGRSFSDPSPEGWTVRKDGGAFDQFTGATITPRAVTRAMGRALALHAQQGERWFEENTGP
jgi:electron transport complex protein RnfG